MKKFPIGASVRHPDFGVGQVVPNVPPAREWQTTVVFETPATETTLAKRKKRRVPTTTLVQVEARKGEWWPKN